MKYMENVKEIEKHEKGETSRDKHLKSVEYIDGHLLKIHNLIGSTMSKVNLGRGPSNAFLVTTNP